MNSPLFIDRVALDLTQPRPLYGRRTKPWVVAETFGAIVARSQEEALDLAAPHLSSAPKIEKVDDITYNPGPDIDWYHCPHQPYQHWYVALLTDPKQLEVVKDFYQTLTGSSNLRVRFGGIDIGDQELYPTPYNQIREQTVRVMNPSI
jgi:hypothetical protein